MSKSSLRVSRRSGACPVKPRSAIHSPSCASSVQNQLTPPAAVRVDAKMAMREIRPRRLSGLNPRCDIFGHRGTRERIRLFAGFGRAFLRIARHCVDLLHIGRAAGGGSPGSVQSGDRVLVWKRGSAGLRGGRQMVSQSRGAGIRRSSISARTDDGHRSGDSARQYRGGELVSQGGRTGCRGRAVQPGNDVCLRPGRCKRLRGSGEMVPQGGRSGIRGSAIQSGRILSRRAGCRSGLRPGADVVREGGGSGDTPRRSSVSD